MPLALLHLRRCVDMRKQVWRRPETRRTLAPRDPGGAFRAAYETWLATSHSPAIVESDWETPQARPAKAVDHTGVFEVRFEEGLARIRLLEEACRLAVHTPRRPTQHIASLRPWQVVRVVLNGKADWSSGRFYYLLDSYLTLCDAAAPLGWQAGIHTIDLQADLT